MSSGKYARRDSEVPDHSKFLRATFHFDEHPEIPKVRKASLYSDLLSSRRASEVSSAPKGRRIASRPPRPTRLLRAYIPSTHTPRRVSIYIGIGLFVGIFCAIIFNNMSDSLLHIPIQAFTFLFKIAINIFTGIISIFKQQDTTNILQNVASIITILTAILTPISIFIWRRTREQSK